MCRLQHFCEALTNARFIKEDQLAKLGQRCEGWINARLEAFEKCGFYEPDLKPHGGPDPNVGYKATDSNHWGEENEKLDLGRRRRSAEDCSNWDGKIDYHLTYSYRLYHRQHEWNQLLHVQ